MQYLHANLPTTQKLYRTYGDPAQRGKAYHLNDAAIRKLHTSATQVCVKGGLQYYSNHTHRYQQDAGYRNDCQSHVPPAPEHLYYVNGDYVW